jgi:hypothetical protein
MGMSKFHLAEDPRCPLNHFGPAEHDTMNAQSYSYAQVDKYIYLYIPFRIFSFTTILI